MTPFFYAFALVGCALMVLLPAVATVPALVGVMLWLLYACATLVLAYLAVHQVEGADR